MEPEESASGDGVTPDPGTAAEEATAPFEDAYAAYARAMRSAWSGRENARRLDESVRRFAQAMREAWSAEERQQRAEEAYREYVRSAQEAWSPDELEHRSEHAYRSYVRSLQDAWARLEPDSVEPAQLAAAADTIARAAWSAAAARESIRQRWNAAAWMASAVGTPPGSSSGTVE